MATALEYLRDLVGLTGVSGTEEDVIRALVATAIPLADSVTVDAFGNVIVTRAAPSPHARHVVLAAHMDEVGFRIKSIDEHGFLRFEKAGGTDNRVLLAQRVWVGVPGGHILGVIGTKSAHLASAEDRATVPPHTAMYIDIGARSPEDARQMGVQIGAQAGFVGELAELGSGTGLYAGHALDDRAGCAVALAVLDRLHGGDSPVSITAVFTVQEEVGLRGAQAAIGGLTCDVGIAIDTTAFDDTPDTGGRALQLGDGPAIKLMDNSQLAHPAVRRGMEAAAETEGIPVQHEILMGIGTDAGALQFGGSGIPVGTLSIGTRYTHSPVEVLDQRDLDGAVRLLHRFLLDLPQMDLRFVAIE